MNATIPQEQPPRQKHFRCECGHRMGWYTERGISSTQPADWRWDGDKIQLRCHLCGKWFTVEEAMR